MKERIYSVIVFDIKVVVNFLIFFRKFFLLKYILKYIKNWLFFLKGKLDYKFNIFL